MSHSEHPRLTVIRGGADKPPETLIPLNFYRESAERLAEHIKQGSFDAAKLEERLATIRNAYERIKSKLQELDTELGDIKAKKKILYEGLAGARLQLLERDLLLPHTAQKKADIEKMIDEIDKAEGISVLRAREKAIFDQHKAISEEIAAVQAKLRRLCAPVYGEPARTSVEQLFAAAGMSESSPYQH